MMATRRQVVAGRGAAALLPAAGGAARAALDEAATLQPDAALARLRGVAGGSPGDRLDLAAARAGLAIDAALLTPPTAAAALFGLRVRRIVGDGATVAVVARDLAAALDAITARATRLFDAIGIPGRTTGARFDAWWRDPRWHYPDAAAAVADMRATLAAIRPRLSSLVGPVPPHLLTADIRALDAAEIAAGKGGYRIMPDAGRPGWYVVDLARLHDRPRGSLASVVAHETLPGHLLHLPLEAQAAPHPLRLRYAAAFGEGWGSHAEMIADRAGVFATPGRVPGRGVAEGWSSEIFG